MKLDEMIAMQANDPVRRILAAKEEPKISAITNDQLTEVMVYLYKLTGIPPDKLPMSTPVLTGYIRNNYPGFTLLDLVNAFTLGISGKLDLRIEDTNPYNNFSTLYIERILQAYNRLRYSVLSNNRIEQQEMNSQEHELTVEERDQALCGWFASVFDDYKKTGDFMSYGFPLYEKMKKRGFVPFTKEREAELWKKAAAMIERPSGGGFLQAKRSFTEFNRCNHEEAYRYLCLRTMFDDLIETGDDPAGLFEESLKHQP